MSLLSPHIQLLDSPKSITQELAHICCFQFRGRDIEWINLCSFNLLIIPSGMVIVNFLFLSLAYLLCLFFFFLIVVILYEWELCYNGGEATSVSWGFSIFHDGRLLSVHIMQLGARLDKDFIRTSVTIILRNPLIFSKGKIFKHLLCFIYFLRNIFFPPKCK